MSINLPPLGDFPATGTDAEKSQWLKMADLRVQVDRLASDKLTRYAITELTAKFSEVYPKMGAMDFEQAIELLKLVKGAT